MINTNKSNSRNKQIFVYVLKFLGVFCLCYFGTLAVIGLAAPGGFYSPLIAEYLDYVSWARTSLLLGAKNLLALFNYDTYNSDPYVLRVKNGHGVIMAYSCVGYGILSFWIAFVVSNKGSLWKKLIWLLGGILAISIINIIRIALLLVAINRHWAIPFFDHHTWFNIAAYALILLMMWFYDKQHKISSALNHPVSNPALN